MILCQSVCLSISPECQTQQVHKEKKSSNRCNICGSGFSLRSSVRVHILTVHGAKAFKCKICAKDFTERKSLRRHVATIHEKKRPFKCEFCEKSFAQKDKMVISSRLHKKIQLLVFQKHLKMNSN